MVPPYRSDIPRHKALLRPLLFLCLLGSKPRVLLGESSLIRLLCALSLSLCLFRDGLHIYFMNVGRDVRIDLADDSAGSYFKRGNVICIIFISSFLSAVFAGCDRSLIREMHCPA